MERPEKAALVALSEYIRDARDALGKVGRLWVAAHHPRP